MLELIKNVIFMSSVFIIKPVWAAIILNVAKLNIDVHGCIYIKILTI